MVRLVNKGLNIITNAAYQNALSINENQKIVAIIYL